MIPSGLRNVDPRIKLVEVTLPRVVQGYRLAAQTLCFPEPVPVFAVWRENSRSEAAILLEELEENRLHITEVNLGEVRLAELGLPEKYRQRGGWLLTPKQLPPVNHTWKQDLYDYRKETIELLFERIMQTFDL